MVVDDKLKRLIRGHGQEYCSGAFFGDVDGYSMINNLFKA
jgi:hypothetical protein